MGTRHNRVTKKKSEHRGKRECFGAPIRAEIKKKLVLQRFLKRGYSEWVGVRGWLYCSEWVGVRGWL